MQLRSIMLLAYMDLLHNIAHHIMMLTPERC